MLLKFLRKKKNMKRIIWGLAIIIIPAFVIWGSGTSNKKDGKTPTHAGEIFNKKVSFEKYADMWRISRDSLVRSFGNNVPVELIDQMAWNRLILLTEAKRKNIKVKDEEVVERLVSFPAFQRDGSFDKKLYKSMLGTSVRAFEERLRDDICISKLREKITSDALISEEELKEEYKKKFEKIKASYIAVPFEDFEKDVQYKESDAIEFYEKNKEDFMKPEHRNVKYIPILLSSFDKEVDITDEEIQRYFEEHMLDFKKPDSEEEVVLNDEIKKDITEKLSTKRKYSLSEELAYRVLDNAINEKDLEKIASSFNLETKETGFFSMQREIPNIGWSYEFTKKSFDLDLGETSNIPIKTDKGFYIIQLKDKKPPYIPNFSEVKDSVKESYLEAESVKLAQEKSKELLSSIKNKMEDGTNFENAIKDLELEIKKTEFVTRPDYIQGLGRGKELVELVLSIKNQEIAGPLKMQTSWIILRRDEYQNIDEVKFVEEKVTFKETLLSSKKEKVFNEWFEKLKTEANFVSYISE